MKPVTGFLTDDGEFFESEAEAIAHEDRYRISNVIDSLNPKSYGIPCAQNSDHVVAFVMDLLTGYPELAIEVAQKHIVIATPQPDMCIEAAVVEAHPPKCICNECVVAADPQDEVVVGRSAAVELHTDTISQERPRRTTIRQPNDNRS
ncbi:hypothetical protein VPHK469_0134 [Vibrio phage K469]